MQKFKVVSLSLKSTHYDTLLPHDNFSIFYLNIISSVCKTARVKKSQGYYFFPLSRTLNHWLWARRPTGFTGCEFYLCSSCNLTIITSPNPTKPTVKRNGSRPQSLSRLQAQFDEFLKRKKKRLHVTVPHRLSKAITCILFPLVWNTMWRRVYRSGCDLVNRMPPPWGFSLSGI